MKFFVAYLAKLTSFIYTHQKDRKDGAGTNSVSLDLYQHGVREQDLMFKKKKKKSLIYKSFLCIAGPFCPKPANTST